MRGCFQANPPFGKHSVLFLLLWLNFLMSGSHKSIWEALKSCNVDHEYVSLLRKIYKDQKASVQTDEESESFDIQKGSKQGDPMSSLLFNMVLQYSLKKRNTTMAKEERNGNLLERPRTRRPNEPAICRRRDAVRNLQRTDTEYDVRIQESNRESGTQDPPRQDENSQQPEQHEFRHKKIY